MVSTGANAAPSEEVVVGVTSTEDIPDEDEDKESPQSMTRSASRNNVLDLTGAAIATAETAHTEQGNDAGEVLVNAGSSAVPSISLPRQSTDVRHFAMGKFCPRETMCFSGRVSRARGVYSVNTFLIHLSLCPSVDISTSQIWEARS